MFVVLHPSQNVFSHRVRSPFLVKSCKLFYGHLSGTVTFPVAKHLAVSGIFDYRSQTLPGFFFGDWLGFEHPTFHIQDKCSNHLHHHQDFWSYSLKWSPNVTFNSNSIYTMTKVVFRRWWTLIIHDNLHLREKVLRYQRTLQNFVYIETKEKITVP